MLRLLKGFIKDEDGLGTVEIIIIIAVLVAIALLFRNTIMTFVKKILGQVFSTEVIKIDPNAEVKPGT